MISEESQKNLLMSFEEEEHILSSNRRLAGRSLISEELFKEEKHEDDNWLLEESFKMFKEVDRRQLRSLRRILLLREKTKQERRIHREFAIPYKSYNGSKKKKRKNRRTLRRYPITKLYKE